MRNILLTGVLLTLTSPVLLAQTQPVERAKQRTQNRVNNKVDNKVDNAVDKGLDKIEGLFNRKKNDGNANDKNGDKGNKVLQSVLGGSDAKYEQQYTFESNFLIESEYITGRGKSEGKMRMRSFIAKELQYLGTEIYDQKDPSKIMASSVLDFNNKAMISLVNSGDQPMGVVMGLPKADDFIDDDADDAKMPKITPTNESKTILGYKCNKVIVEDDESISHLWITKDIKIDQFKAMAYSFASAKTKQKSQPAGAKNLEGFMMEMDMTNKKDGSRSIMKVIEMNQNQPKTFDLSKYQIVRAGGLLGGAKD